MKQAYIWQTLAAALFGFLVLIALGGYKHVEILAVVGFTSLGSSAFILFSGHDTKVASARSLFGGYSISIVCGIIFFVIAHALVHRYPQLVYDYIFYLMAACAFAVSMFVMLLTMCEHPPAAGLTLGLVTEHWTYLTLLIIFVAICVLTLIRRLLNSRLCNLL